MANSEAKHTSGPWKADAEPQRLDGRAGTYRRIVEAGCFPNILAHVCVSHPVNGELNEHGEANARLIAAAPELLEALNRIAKLIPVAADCRTGKNLVEYSDDEWGELCAVTPMVYAALSKATGEPQ
jgi:hypothetical protein